MDREKHKLLGLCIHCKKKAIKGRVSCLYHLEYNIKSSKKSMALKGKESISKRKRKKYLTNIENGICTQCGKILNREFEPHTKCFNCSELTHRGR